MYTRQSLICLKTCSLYVPTHQSSSISVVTCWTLCWTRTSMTQPRFHFGSSPCEQCPNKTQTYLDWRTFSSSTLDFCTRHLRHKSKRLSLQSITSRRTTSIRSSFKSLKRLYSLTCLTHKRPMNWSNLSVMSLTKKSRKRSSLCKSPNLGRTNCSQIEAVMMMEARILMNLSMRRKRILLCSNKSSCRGQRIKAISRTWMTFWTSRKSFFFSAVST